MVKDGQTVRLKKKTMQSWWIDKDYNLEQFLVLIHTLVSMKHLVLETVQIEFQSFVVCYLAYVTNNTLDLSVNFLGFSLFSISQSSNGHNTRKKQPHSVVF